MKRAMALGTMGVLLAASLVMPVSAHGHHQNRTVQTVDAVCEICTVEGCDKTGLHVHDDETYCGYAHENGYCDGSCGAVAVCTVEGCDKTGHHTHDDETYCGYAHGCGYCDGSCGAVAVCTVEGCDKTGRHTHDGEAYCGYAHGNGYCDGSCARTTDTKTSRHCGRIGRHCR